jgi:hypothetical protein
MKNTRGQASPAGFAALAMASLLIWVDQCGYMPPQNAPLIPVMLIAAGITQIITGVIELKRGDTSGGALFLMMGNLFMLGPGLGVLLEFIYKISLAPLLGWVNILLGIFLLAWSIPFSKKPWVIFLISPGGFLFLGLFGCTIAGIGPPILKPIDGWIGFFFVCWSIYIIMHILGEEVGIHLPVGKPIRLPKERKPS